MLGEAVLHHDYHAESHKSRAFDSKVVGKEPIVLIW